jgi:hypothetical protein
VPRGLPTTNAVSPWSALRPETLSAWRWLIYLVQRPWGRLKRWRKLSAGRLTRRQRPVASPPPNQCCLGRPCVQKHYPHGAGLFYRFSGRGGGSNGCGNRLLAVSPAPTASRGLTVPTAVSPWSAWPPSIPSAWGCCHQSVQRK